MKIHIANNDDNGNWTDSFSSVEFEIEGEPALRLETRTMKPVKAEVFDPSFVVQQLRIHGVTVKCSLLGTWTGNMKWNTIEMLDDYALGFLRALQLSKQWAVIEGWTMPFQKFENGDEITGKDFDMEEDIQPRVVNPNQLEINF